MPFQAGTMHTVITPSVLYFGTPVALVSTLNADGTTNLSPISSLFALGTTYALGLATDGHAVANLARRRELVINLPDADLVEAIERIAATTGASPVPIDKAPRYRHVQDKWRLGGLTRVPSATVGPDRVLECPVHLEARVVDITPFAEGTVLVQARVAKVHARADLVQPGTSYLDLARWRPLYYTFRHYFAQGEEVGVSFKAEQ